MQNLNTFSLFDTNKRFHVTVWNDPKVPPYISQNLPPLATGGILIVVGVIIPSEARRYRLSYRGTYLQRGTNRAVACICFFADI